MRSIFRRVQYNGEGAAATALRHRSALTALCGALFLLAGLGAQSSPAFLNPVPGNWTLTGANVTETETNNSAQPVVSFYLVLPSGVTVTGGGSVSGATATCLPGEPGKVANEVQCRFPSGWQSGTSITFTFPVSDPRGRLRTNPPPTFQKYVSFNGTTYTPPFEVPPATNTSGLPPAQTNLTPSAPGEQPCKCLKLTAFLNHFHIFGAGSTGIEFDVNWRLTCSAGAGNCSGTIKVLAPRGAYFIEQGGRLLAAPQPRIVTVTCPGPCSQQRKGRQTLRYLALQRIKDKKGKTHIVPNPRFTPAGRANKSFEIRLSVLCNNPPGQIIKLRVTFDKHGQVDYRKSFLTGPG